MIAAFQGGARLRLRSGTSCEGVGREGGRVDEGDGLENGLRRLTILRTGLLAGAWSRIGIRP